jgi:hypothetical protein
VGTQGFDHPQGVNVMTTMLQVPRSRGAVSGLLLVLLGLWGALIPLVGPYFHYAYTPDSAWTLTAGRVWLEIVPGAATFLGGIILLASASRPLAMFGAELAAAAGARHGDHPAVARGQDAGPGLPGGHDHGPPAA